VVGCRAARSPPFCGEVGVNPLAEPALLLPPAEALGDQDLVDPAPPDADPLGVEVVLKPVERPGTEGQAQGLRVGQRGGEDLGDLLGGVGRGPAGAGHVGQAGGPLGVEPGDPPIDRGPGDAERRGGRGDLHAAGECGDDLGPLDGSGLGGAGAGQVLDGLPLVGG
jgi:hypothetical protein